MPKTELESFADTHATEVFTPLYQNDLFMLDRLEKSGNHNAYLALLWELVAKWTIPNESEEELEEVDDFYGEVDGQTL